MSSKIKVDSIETVSGSGTISIPTGNNLSVGGTSTFTGASTFGEIRPNNIASTSGTNAMSISSGGVVTFPNMPVGASQTELIHSVTITSGSSSELDFNGHFSSTYTNYELHGTNVHVSGDGAHLGIRVLIADAIKSDNQYRYTRIRIYSGSSASVSANVVGAVEASDTEFAFFGGESNGNDTGENSNFKITIFDPLATDNFKTIKSECSYIDLSPDAGQIHGSGHYKSGTAALTGIRLFVNSGNIASGKFKLYGIR